MDTLKKKITCNSKWSNLNVSLVPSKPRYLFLFALVRHPELGIPLSQRVVVELWSYTDSSSRLLVNTLLYTLRCGFDD